MVVAIFCCKSGGDGSRRNGHGGGSGLGGVALVFLDKLGTNQPID